MDRGSDRPARGIAIDRRTFLGAASLLLLSPRLALAAPGDAAKSLPETTVELLDKSKLVYISPLKKDGTESTCHGEVWFTWLDGSVLINSRRGTWKVRALKAGLDRARIWVGDHGRWKDFVNSKRSHKYLEGPSFDARAHFETDRAVLERLIKLYGDKYGGDFDRWREDMQTGFYSGQRMLIRYTPV